MAIKVSTSSSITPTNVHRVGNDYNRDQSTMVSEQQQQPQQPQQLLPLQQLKQLPSSSSSSSYRLIFGLFVFYIGHDALQERIFRLDGFEFGFFMTFVEVIVMLLASILLNHNNDTDTDNDYRKSNYYKRQKRKEKKNKDENHHPFLLPRSKLPMTTLLRIAWVGFLLALAHGLGNTSLKYSPYPLKVAFKSCKLVPTMIVGACLTYDRRYTALQYTAALIMGFGLAMLSFAETTTTTTSTKTNSRQLLLQQEQTMDFHYSQTSNRLSREVLPYLGPLLLTISTAIDSAVPNMQEQLLRSKRVHTSDMIRISNGVMCACLGVYIYISGEFNLAFSYCTIDRKDALFLLLLQGVCAYFGLRCYLSIIRVYGGVIGVLLANVRKVITIILSFVLFAKPFHMRHGMGLLLVGIGVFLGSLSKTVTKSTKTEEDEMNDITMQILSTGEEKENELHEHSV